MNEGIQTHKTNGFSLSKIEKKQKISMALFTERDFYDIIISAICYANP